MKWGVVTGPSVLTADQDRQKAAKARSAPTAAQHDRSAAGKFTVGSPETEAGRSINEKPQNAVTIAKPLAVGRTDVTSLTPEATPIDHHQQEMVADAVAALLGGLEQLVD